MSTYRLTKARGIAVVSTWRLTKARGTAAGPPAPSGASFRLVRARGSAVPQDSVTVTAPATVDPGEDFTISAVSTDGSPTWSITQTAGPTFTRTDAGPSWAVTAGTPAALASITFRITATTDHGTASTDVTIVVYPVNEYRSDGSTWQPRILARL